nr:V-type proton ATPase subunit E1 [Ipomoea batatas]
MIVFSHKSRRKFYSSGRTPLIDEAVPDLDPVNLSTPPFSGIKKVAALSIVEMGFLVTTLIFVAVGVIASLCITICCNRGASTNLLHLTLVLTATVCCWMMWAIVYLAQMKPLIVPILSEGE